MKYCTLFTLLFLINYSLFGQNLLAINSLEPDKNKNSGNSRFLMANEPTVRPFITDDARVVGYRLAQLESWLRIDKESGQQWLMFAYGPTKYMEVTVGGGLGL